MAVGKTKKNEAAPAEEGNGELVEAVEEVPLEVAPEGIPASAPGGPVPGRKSLGVKEPIVFKWKIVGRSGSMIVTLFKSVEREEADAQLERLTRDGYYTNLQILEASVKVEQPPQPREKKPAKPVEPPVKVKEKPAAPSKAPMAKSASKSVAPKKKSAATATTEKAKPKPTKKPAKKK